MLEKLLGLMSVGSSFASLTILHRFLSKLVIVLALTIVSALMTGALILTAFYGLYWALISNGFTPTCSIFTVVGLALALTALAIGLTFRELSKLRRTSAPTLQQGFPSLASLSHIAEAFMDGLLGRQNHT